METDGQLELCVAQVRGQLARLAAFPLLLLRSPDKIQLENTN